MLIKEISIARWQTKYNFRLKSCITLFFWYNNF
jgi:hypothetical protein